MSQQPKSPVVGDKRPEELGHLTDFCLRQKREDDTAYNTSAGRHLKATNRTVRALTNRTGSESPVGTTPPA